MLVLSKKQFYAVEAVLYIACHGKTQPIASRELAEKQDLPPRYLEHVLQTLVHTGILRSVRGPQGGYLLGRERRRLTLRDIIDTLSVEEPTLGDCPPATPLGTRILWPVCTKSAETMLAQLAEIDLATLCEQAEQLLSRPTGSDNQDFMI